jgi:hypothetical protein
MKSLSPGSIANLSNPSEIQPVLAFDRRCYGLWESRIKCRHRHGDQGQNGATLLPAIIPQLKRRMDELPESGSAS